ncbi:Gfo/Idh/MocA family oxidoreductase [Paenibacillus sp. TRM 82003]|nr:Gfo/Idh/MocA family oxidoreductase [Paenibacillus sp. TRM 82003]
MVRVGIVGTGWFGKKHAELLARMNGVRVQAFCGSSQAKAEAAALPFDGAGAYGNVRDMLDTEKLDAVYICVPPMAHGEIERELIERGVPFLVEKPLGVDADLPKELAERIRARGLVTSVGYHFRYQEATDRLKQQLAERTVGMASGGWMGGMPGVYWWRRKEGSGGQFIEQTTHLVDLLRYVAGEIEEVYGAFAQRTMHERMEDVDVADVGTAVLKLRSGAVATLSNTCLLPGDAGQVNLSFYTPEGRLEWTPGHLTAIGGGQRSAYAGGLDPYRLENEAFLHAVRTGDVSRIRSDYADALRTQLVAYAITRSAETGVPVKIEEA